MRQSFCRSTSCPCLEKVFLAIVITPPNLLKWIARQSSPIFSRIPLPNAAFADLSAAETRPLPDAQVPLRKADELGLRCGVDRCLSPPVPASRLRAAVGRRRNQSPAPRTRAARRSRRTRVTPNGIPATSVRPVSSEGSYRRVVCRLHHRVVDRDIFGLGIGFGRQPQEN